MLKFYDIQEDTFLMKHSPVLWYFARKKNQAYEQHLALSYVCDSGVPILYHKSIEYIFFCLVKHIDIKLKKATKKEDKKYQIAIYLLK